MFGFIILLIMFVIILFLLGKHCTPNTTISDIWRRSKIEIILISLSASLSFHCLISMVVDNIYKNMVFEETIPIFSLSNGTEPNGSFFIGSGSVNGVEYYYYFTQSGSGYTRGKIRVEESIIIEDSEISSEIEGSKMPVIISFHSTLPEHLKYWFFDVQSCSIYHIMVPSNTIIKQFSVH